MYEPNPQFTNGESNHSFKREYPVTRTWMNCCSPIPYPQLFVQLPSVASICRNPEFQIHVATPDFHWDVKSQF